MSGIAETGESGMDVLDVHQHVVEDYAVYTKSFIRISDERIAETVLQEIPEGLLWPEPLLQLDLFFASGKRLTSLFWKTATVMDRRLDREGDQ